jgi:hypothetical protein
VVFAGGIVVYSTVANRGAALLPPLRQIMSLVIVKPLTSGLIRDQPPADEFHIRTEDSVGGKGPADRKLTKKESPIGHIAVGTLSTNWVPVAVIRSAGWNRVKTSECPVVVLTLKGLLNWRLR